MISHDELRSFVGKKGDLPAGRNRDGGYDLTVRVQVKDARTTYGHIDLLVTPLAGAGEKWVRRSNMTVDGMEQP